MDREADRLLAAAETPVRGTTRVATATPGGTAAAEAMGRAEGTVDPSADCDTAHFDSTIHTVFERGFAIVFKTVSYRTLLVLLIALTVATGLTTIAADDVMHCAASENLIQQALLQMEIAFEQGLDSNGEPIWLFAHRGITAMILPHDRIDSGAYESLLFYAAWSTETPFEFSVVNDWNRRARFGRAYVDEQGDPVIELDLLLSGGVTLETIKAYIAVFVDSALSLASVVQQ